MEAKERMILLLKEQYGITSAEALEKAIAKLTPIDLTPFCGTVKN